MAVSVIAGSVVKSCLLVASLSATVFARVLIMAARGLHVPTELEERAVMARRVLPVKVTPGQGAAAVVKGSLDIASIPAELPS